jgi:hypothetical protein
LGNLNHDVADGGMMTQFSFSAHEDAAEGSFMQQAMQDYEEKSLLFKPKPIKADIKISAKKLKKQMGKEEIYLPDSVTVSKDTCVNL